MKFIEAFKNEKISQKELNKIRKREIKREIKKDMWITFKRNNKSQ